MNKLGVSLPWDYLSDTIITKEAEVITKNFGKSTTYTHIILHIYMTWVLQEEPISRLKRTMFLWKKM